MVLETNLEAFLRDQRLRPQQGVDSAVDLEREFSIYRSGSAPPTVNGSWRAVESLGASVGGVAAQRVIPGTIGDQRRAGAHEGGAGPAAVRIDRVGTRRRSFKDVVQGHVDKSTSTAGYLSHPAGYSTSDIVIDPMVVSDAQITGLHKGLRTLGVHSEETLSPAVNRVQSIGSSMSHPFTTAPDSYSSRNAIPDLRLTGMYPNLCLPPIGGRMPATNNSIHSNNFNGVPSFESDCGDITVALSGLNLSKSVKANGEDYLQGLLHHELANQNELSLNMSSNQHQYLHQKITEQSEDPFNTSTVPFSPYNGFSKRNGFSEDTNFSRLTYGQKNTLKQASSNNFCNGEVSMCFKTSSGYNGQYQYADAVGLEFTRHNSNSNGGLPALLSRQPDAGHAYASRIRNHVGSELTIPIVDPLHTQYLPRRTGSAAAAAAANRLNNFSLSGDYVSASSHMDLPAYQRTYVSLLMAQQKLHGEKAFFSKYGSFNHGFNDGPPIDLGMPYLASPCSVLSFTSPMSSLKQSGRRSFHSARGSSMGGSTGSRNHDNGIIEDDIATSMLEEFKSSKRNFELSEILDHVVRFSVDQHGSRFIQQKLETTSLEEKNKIFFKMLPHCHILMIDVFGNYVIQKFFEHGTESQIQQLAAELIGHVLPLSLQMYGCRVIQKALEVIDVDQKTQMVLELDGSVMKCVHDQNGNHVIQKCIECVPQDRIQFIISAFYGQVVALSSHPYGCRVIQRVLEYCDDADTQKNMMDEIMQYVCVLAQDQYGNYVIQHVLQHGKPEQRSFIISKLSGQIVKMSQQKFASNVVEKCLTYGTSEERLLLINEMLGSTDENEPLQDMMKDQFGNYVVQKVLEICDDQKRELILSRIKVQLATLKRYVYGKHLVARVEKLIATGERLMQIRGLN